jgi:hypothetical protein
MLLKFLLALVKAETKQAAISLEQVVRRLSHHVKPGWNSLV